MSSNPNLVSILKVYQKRRKLRRRIVVVLTRTRFGPKLVAGLVKRVVADVDDVNGVTFIGQILECPFQSVLAAL